MRSEALSIAALILAALWLCGSGNDVLARVFAPIDEDRDSDDRTIRIEKAVLSGQPERAADDVASLASGFDRGGAESATARGCLAIASWHRERPNAPGESMSDRIREARRWLDRAVHVAVTHRQRTEAREQRSYAAAFLGDFGTAESDLDLARAAYLEAADRESAARCLRRRAFLELQRGRPELVDDLLDQRARELSQALGHAPPLDNTDEYLRIVANIDLGRLDRAAQAAERHGAAERALLRDAPYPIILGSYRRSQFNLGVLAGHAVAHAEAHPEDEARIFALLAGFMEGARVRALRAVLGGFEARPEGFTLEDLRPLPPQILLLRYLVASDSSGERRRWILLASRASERRVVDLGDADAADRACETFIERWLGKAALAAPAREYGVAASNLAKLTLGPVTSWLADETAARLLIVAEGALTRLPFQSLVLAAPPSHTSSYGELDYLVRHAAVLHLPSFGVVDALARPTAEDSCLALLAPERVGEAPLHFAALEERAIATAHPKTTVLRGRFASRSALLEHLNDHAPGWLHLACHARSDSSSGQRAVLELARDRGTATEESELTVADVATLPLRRGARVVLSACGTASGDYMRGEGVLGLWRAFLAAGASCVVSTLRDVDDRSIAVWTGTFHSAAARGLPLSDAARQADLAWVEGRAQPRFPRGAPSFDPAHPALWAVMLCVGDDGGAIPGRNR